MRLQPAVLNLLKAPMTYLSLAIFAFFLWIIRGEFGHTDDYLFLIGFSYADDGLFRGISLMGRPLAAIWQFHSFRLGEGMETLFFIRLMSLVLTAPIVLILAKCWREAGAGGTSGIRGMLLILTPSLGVYLTWAGTQVALISILISLYAGLLFIRALQPPRSRLCSKFLFTGFLILASLCFYQPTGFFFLIPIFIQASCRDLPKGAWPMAFGLLLGVLMLYFIPLKASHLFLFDETLAASRGNFSNAISTDRLISLLQFPLLGLFGNWAEFGSDQVAWMVRAVVATLVAIHLLSRKSLAYPTAWLAAFFGSLIPMLLTGNDFPFRTISFQFALVMIGLLGGMQVVMARLRLGRSSTLVLCTLTLLSAGSLIWFTEFGISKPNRADYRKHREHLATIDQRRPSIVVYNLSQKIQMSPVKKLREYGSASTWVDWVPFAVYKIASSQLDPLNDPLPTHPSDFNDQLFLRVFPWQNRETGNHILFLDRRLILTGKNTPPWHVFDPERWSLNRRTYKIIPQYGKSEILSDGWIFSEHWGYCYPFEDESLFHASMGLCLLKNGRLWKLDTGIGPVYFNPSEPGTGFALDGTKYRLEKKGFKAYSLIPQK